MADDEDIKAIWSVLDFWFMPDMENYWFGSYPQFDKTIVERFAGLHEKAARGDLDHWHKEADSALALVILLDQFSRNIHRGTPKAFASDARALALAKYALERGFDQELPERERQFFYLPLMHSERMDDQHRCVELYDRLELETAIKAAHEHYNIIARFGRFPHRNSVLGRQTTVEEAEFMRIFPGF